MKQLNKNTKFKHNIAIIPGDGIGPEVITASLIVIEKALELDNINIKKKYYPWGSNYFKKYKKMMAKDGLDRLRQHDAIFFGAVGDKYIADDVTLWGLRLEICQNLDQFANVRPSKYMEGIARQPELQGYLLGQFFFMMAVVDALPIISLGLGLLQIFA